MKTVMHSLNDLRVLLSDPFTQAFILEALKEDHTRFINQASEKQMKLPTNKESNGEENQESAERDGEAH
jgi:hypothetical protein